MNAEIQVEQCNYDVEVSGWDREQDFFVEKTVLEWYENRGKTVYVRHPVTSGAVVFVRLIDPQSAQAAFPIAYQVDSVTPPDIRGVRRAKLQQLQPRAVMPYLRKAAAPASMDDIT